MPKVRCTVNSCEFWGEDQVCKAEEIWVKNDISGDVDDFGNHFINASMAEFGKEFGAKKGETTQEKWQAKSARTSPQTCCDTMRPKQ
jgi:hypothetical protein